MAEKDLYQVLGVGRDADAKTIREAYKDLAREKHPDKGGDPEEFKAIQGAYEILKDDDRRRMYDMTGQTQEGGGGMPQGGPFGGFPFGMGGMGFTMDMSDLFGGMFGMGGARGGPPRGRQMRRPKGSNKVHELPLSVSDFYHGKKMRMDLARQVFCKDCNGDGCINWKTCSDCRGTGIRETMIQIGPGMSALNRGPCGSCRSEGRLRGATCDGCKGKGLLPAQKQLDIEIKAGAAINDILVFEEACSDHPDFEKPGDVHIRLVEAAEKLDIERDGIHFRYRAEIGLKESLLGSKRTIKDHPGFLKGLEVDIPAGIQNGEIVVLEGKGMPTGHLFLHISVKVKEEERKQLQSSKAILESLFN
jgi:DnaJ family protein A protein 2